MICKPKELGGKTACSTTPTMYKRLLTNSRIFYISILIIVISLKILYYIRANLSKNVEEIAEGK